ncbi:MAG: transcription-repair coupling factor [Erysipelothrix sp.]|nr:transcription-repair coupling factor [Erysipelothrix sp.]
MQKLLSFFDNYELVKQIQKNKDGQVFSFTEEALSLASFYNTHKQQIIIVKDNLYHAEQLYDSLSNLSDDVYIYMTEESKRLENIATSPEFTANRLSVLNMLLNNETGIFITHTAALLRYLPDVKVFRQAILTFENKQVISYKGLKKKLIQAGYKFSKRVDQPLTFSMRGEVVDIYSINYDNPIRIEFFDNEVESIRFFDIDSQLTIKLVEKVTITPATDILFSESEKDLIIEKLNIIVKHETKHKFYDSLNNKISRDISYLNNNVFEQDLYNYYGLLSKESSLLDYCQDNLLILSDSKGLFDNEKMIISETIEFVKEQYEIGRNPLILDLWVDAKRLLEKHKYVNLKNTLGQSTDYSKIHEIDVAINQFDYIIEDIINYSKENCTILALNESEINEVKAYLQQRDISYSNKLTKIESGIFLMKKSLIKGFYYKNLYVYTSRELFNTKINVTKYSSKFNESQSLSNYGELEKGDFVVHNTYGVGKYIGIETREFNNYKRDFLKIIYKNNDSLHVPLHQFNLVRKFVSREGMAPRLNRLGTDEWQKTKNKVKENVNELAGRLVKLYSTRSIDSGFQFEIDEIIQREFNNEVEFVLTNDQEQAEREIILDMQSKEAMDRLLIGDVGFGKTEVSMRAAFMAAYNGKQVAFLCPTTILSSQHYETFRKRFRNFPVSIRVINRFVTLSEQKEIIKEVIEGKVDILIGTHRLLSKDVKFKDLGLLIIDEEQRFGVDHKERIKELKTSVDVLSLSATPIPRTLQMSLVGIRSMSTLREAPKNRKPVQTYVIEKNIATINHVIMRELARNGQAFYLHNNVRNLPDIAGRLERDIEGVKVAIVHGQMDRDTIEDVMIRFTLNEYNVLVCTTIIETGIDIQNANTIIIDNADTFGLSQLYQIRGRVGRSDRVAYAYLMYQPEKILSEIATKRLNTIKEFTQLGSGHKIAMRDLTIRGAGDMLGPAQSGFIDTVGIDMYIEMLNEAIKKEKGEKVIKPSDDSIRVDSAGHIPEDFTEFDYDKITLYQDIDKQTSLKTLQKLYDEESDYYGTLPEDINLLFERKRLEIILSNPNISNYKELLNRAEVTFTKAFSDNVDGIQLFSDISSINSKIKLDYKYQKITLKIKRENNWINDIIKVLETLEIGEESQ